MGNWEQKPSDYKPPADANIQPPPPPVNLGDAVVEGVPPAVESPPEGEFKGLLVREGGDKVFLIKGGKKHWVSNPEAMEKLGFKFGDEAEIDKETLAVLQEGEPLR